MKYYVNNELLTSEEFKSLLHESIGYDADYDFEAMIDETHGEIEICGMTYSASYVLEQVDPVAFNMAMNEYIDSRYEDALYELERGEQIEASGRTFEIEEKTQDEVDLYLIDILGQAVDEYNEIVSEEKRLDWWDDVVDSIDDRQDEDEIRTMICDIRREIDLLKR